MPRAAGVDSGCGRCRGLRSALLQTAPTQETPFYGYPSAFSSDTAPAVGCQTPEPTKQVLTASPTICRGGGQGVDPAPRGQWQANEVLPMTRVLFPVADAPGTLQAVFRLMPTAEDTTSTGAWIGSLHHSVAEVHALREMWSFRWYKPRSLLHWMRSRGPQLVASVSAMRCGYVGISVTTGGRTEAAARQTSSCHLPQDRLPGASQTAPQRDLGAHCDGCIASVGRWFFRPEWLALSGVSCERGRALHCVTGATAGEVQAPGSCGVLVGALQRC